MRSLATIGTGELLVAQQVIPLRVQRSFVATNGHQAILEAIPSPSAGANGAVRLVSALRTLDVATVTGVPGASIQVGGLPAYVVDYERALRLALPWIVSATTRQARAGEVHGDSYYFLTDEDFAARRAAGEFLETAEVFGAGYWYGTLMSELERARHEGGWAFLEIDVQGALRVMQEYPDAVTIFLEPPSVEACEQRLRSRGTDAEETIQRRLKKVQDELQLADRYRFRVVNDDLEQAIGRINDILTRQSE